jgi:hypothetical protein
VTASYTMRKSEVGELRPSQVLTTFGIGSLVDWFDESRQIGVPVAPFPRWLVCSKCRLLAPPRFQAVRAEGDSVPPRQGLFRPQLHNPGTSPDGVAGPLPCGL